MYYVIAHVIVHTNMPSPLPPPSSIPSSHPPSSILSSLPPSFSQSLLHTLPISLPSQMIDSGVFTDINKLTPIESLSLDPTMDVSVTPTDDRRGGWLQRLFKMKRQVHSHVL